MQLKVLVICWGIILCRVSPLHDEVLLFRQKDPKPFLPVRGPPENGEKAYHSLPGSSAFVPNRMAQELAPR